MAKGGKVVVNRSAVTGRIVKASYAKAHPRTTEREVYNRRKK